MGTPVIGTPNLRHRLATGNSILRGKVHELFPRRDLREMTTDPDSVSRTHVTSKPFIMRIEALCSHFIMLFYINPYMYTLQVIIPKALGTAASIDLILDFLEIVFNQRCLAWAWQISRRSLVKRWPFFPYRFKLCAILLRVRECYCWQLQDYKLFVHVEYVQSVHGCLKTASEVKCFNTKPRYSWTSINWKISKSKSNLYANYNLCVPNICNNPRGSNIQVGLFFLNAYSSVLLMSCF